MLLISGCGKKAEIKYTVDELLRTPYNAECTAKIFTNKTQSEYSYGCQHFADGTYTIDYGNMKISVTDSGAVLSGNGMKINTGIEEGMMPLVPTYFFENYLAEGKAEEVEDGYILSCDISEKNPYRASAEMTTDKNLVPVNMRIKDKDGKTVIDIDITKFTRKAE